jgi:predicted restriction endonuclease
MAKPLFIIKNNFQKRSEHYQDILTEDVLRDVCMQLTGERNYDAIWDNIGYNIGRLAILKHNNHIDYISFSEFEIGSRNSFFQSFPSALIKYHLETNPSKKIHFYFLKPNGNIETPYFRFMYRLMKTAETNFLNDRNYLSIKIKPFYSVSDLIVQKNLIRERNIRNKSSYVTIDENDIQIFGKTYGANKYETTLLCLAIHKINPSIQLYEIEEGDLKELPSDARNVIISLGIDVITSDLVLERERKEFEINDSLRSPTYIHNLLEKFTKKECALCNCEIPQIIQGSHIWPVANIKKAKNINLDEKMRYAKDGDNGLWLCSNHHKLFDANILYITLDGRLKYKSKIEQSHKEYLKYLTINTHLSSKVLTSQFIEYLNKRNKSLNLDENLYSFVE